MPMFFLASFSQLYGNGKGYGFKGYFLITFKLGPYITATVKLLSKPSNNVSAYKPIHTV